MGMNYYAVKNGPSLREPIHIGKASMGWMFLFQYQNDMWSDEPVVWRNYDQVREWLKKHTVDSNEYVILNEEEEIVSYDEFVEIVEWKQNDAFCKDNPNNFSHADNVNGYRFTSGDFS